MEPMSSTWIKYCLNFPVLVYEVKIDCLRPYFYFPQAFKCPDFGTKDKVLTTFKNALFPARFCFASVGGSILYRQNCDVNNQNLQKMENFSVDVDVKIWYPISKFWCVTWQKLTSGVTICRWMYECTIEWPSLVPIKVNCLAIPFKYVHIPDWKAIVTNLTVEKVPPPVVTNRCDDIEPLFRRHCCPVVHLCLINQCMV